MSPDGLTRCVRAQSLSSWRAVQEVIATFINRKTEGLDDLTSLVEGAIERLRDPPSPPRLVSPARSTWEHSVEGRDRQWWAMRAPSGTVGNPRLQRGTVIVSDAMEWFAGDVGSLERLGPVATVQILLDIDGSGQTTVYECGALLDTGARVNAIDRSLAQELGLSPANPVLLDNPVWGEWDSDVYPVGIRIAQVDYIELVEAGAVNLPSASYPHKLILGRPFLRDFSLTYDGVAGIVELKKSSGI